MSKKQCPYYQGLCGLDKEEKIVCYSDAPECKAYQEHEEKEIEKLRKQFGFIEQEMPNDGKVFVKYE